MAQATRIGLARHDSETRGAEEVLGHRTPQVPQRLDRGVLLALDERLGIKPEQLAQRSQELGGAVQTDRRLQPGSLETLAEQLAVLAVQADVRFRISELGDIREVRAQRELHIDLCADAFHEATDLGEVGGHVEHAVGGTDDVDAGLRPFRARLERRHFLRTKLSPQPPQRTVRALPLIFVDGARQETLDRGALGGHTATDHLGDRTGHHDRRQVRIEHLVGAFHRALGTVLTELLFGETGDHHRQFVWWQCVGVMQHRGHGQVLAADRAVDDHLQALDGGECVHRSPIAAGAIVIEHQHQGSSSALRALACLSSLRR